jgi:hypothetical protein
LGAWSCVPPRSATAGRSGKAAEAFHPDGSFKDPKTTDLLQKLIARALQVAAKLKS